MTTTPRHGPWGWAVRAALFIAITIALAGMAWADASPMQGHPQASQTQATTAPLDMQVMYVPQEDLLRAPGYSTEGAFLPLSELLHLARAAADRATTDSRARAVYCSGIELSGIASDALRLNGAVTFVAPGSGWSATQIDDGGVPWSGQSAPIDGNAFIARLGGKGYLFAEGPTTGSLAVSVMAPLRPDGHDVPVDLGRFSAPCRITIDFTPGVDFLAASCPARTQDATTTGAESRHVVLWPTAQQSLTLSIRRAAPLEGETAIRAAEARTIAVRGAGIEVSDQIRLMGSLLPGSEIRLGLPGGLRPLKVENSDRTRTELTSDSVVVRPLARLETLTVTVVSAAEIEGDKATVGSWTIPAVSAGGTLRLEGSPQHVPVLATQSDLLIPAGGGTVSRNYDCWGWLPPVEVLLVPAVPALAAEIHAALNLKPLEATGGFIVKLADKSMPELPFQLPDGWTLTNVEGRGPKGENRPVSLIRQDAEKWRVGWQSGQGPESLVLTVHRAGSWGAQGTSSTLALPVLAIEGPRVAAQDFLVEWAEALDVRVDQLDGFAVAPVAEIGAEARQWVPAPRLALRATALSPAGGLLVSGREPDVRATVVSALSLAEDRASARAYITYDVRFAPANTFRFILPKGTGGAVKFEEAGIRERVMRETSAGDEWIVVSQDAVLGTFAISMDWSIPFQPGGAPISAPEIRVPGVSSQRGFILVEGSETLQLQFEPRNLAEADLSEIPQTPWARENRVLAAYRYVQPPYDLSVKAEKFKAESEIGGLVREANLTTTFAPDGMRLTRADYTVAPMGEPQFLDVRLPQTARLWSVTVNGEGAKPARRTDAEGAEIMMVPLPSGGGDTAVSVTYREQGEALDRSTRLALAGPKLPVPVNRTTWNVNLPPGFEYLFYTGTLSSAVTVREPLVTFLRGAYFPKTLIAEERYLMSVVVITFLVFLVLLGIMTGNLVLRRTKPVRVDGTVGTGTPGKSRPGCGLIFELLVVLGVIALLIAIAVPNFLEAQVRSKVSRVRSDARSMATGIESYFVDNNQYPPNSDLLWQGPVKYLTSAFSDPMADYKGAPMRYVVGKEAVEKAIRAGVLPPGEYGSDYWLVYGVGPDGTDNNAEILYDSTNGTVSAGDIVRFKDGGTPIAPTFSETRRAEAARERGYDSSNGTVSKGNVYGLKAEELRTASAPATTPKLSAADRVARHREQQTRPGDDQRLGLRVTPPAPAAAATPPAGILNSNMPDVTVGDFDGTDQNQLFQFKGASSLGGNLEDNARAAGILSLGIEMPEGGAQRRFEGIGGDASLLVRYLSDDSYQRVRFIVWMGVALALGLLWWLWRPAYRWAWWATVALTTLIPLLVGGAWVALFNAALQGALLSLAVPVLARFGGSILRRISREAAAATLILCVIAVVGPASAAENAGSTVTTVVVPYDTATGPLHVSDPVAFVDRGEFAALWNAAQADPATTTPPNVVVTNLEIQGELNPEAGVIRGVMRLGAANTGDLVASASLGLRGFFLTDIGAPAAGGAVGTDESGIVLTLPAHWAGTVQAPFVAPCEMKGASGSLKLNIPDTGSGSWRVLLPYADVESSNNGAAPIIMEKTTTSTVIAGVARQGETVVSWSVGVTGQLADESTPKSWGVSTAIRQSFDSLASALWSANLRLEGNGGALLPRKVEFDLDPSVRLLSIEGRRLTRSVATGGRLVLELEPCATAQVQVEGVVAAPSGGEWMVPAIRPVGSTDPRGTVAVEVSDRIELSRTDPKGLVRSPTREARQGFAIQGFDITNPQWSLTLDLKRAPAMFDAKVSEVMAASGGMETRAARVELLPRGSVIHECALRLAPGEMAETLSGKSVARWVQSGDNLMVAFDPPLEAPSLLELTASRARQTTGSELVVNPLQVPGAADTKRSLALVVSPDDELDELALAGAVVRSPDMADTQLASQFFPTLMERGAVLRSYQLASDAALSFRLVGVPPTLATTVFNKLVLSDGLATLDAQVVAEPRRGRMREVPVLLVLGSPDPRVASRLQPSGPVRNLRVDAVTSTVLLVTAELDAPKSEATQIGLQLEIPVTTDGSTPVAPGIFVPSDAAGARAFLLMHRELAGDVAVESAPGALTVDPASVKWPSDAFRPAPSDIVLDLTAAGRALPSFRITRHKRDEALRAVVEILRQRVIVTDDGMFRCELEMALQNESEQFLKVALPYPRSRISLYEVQVASRVVKAAFGNEAGREVLLIPLIRTGLLDPALTVRVAYTVQPEKPLGRSGSLEVPLPDILGGVPIAESALVLMFPTAYNVSDFEGTLLRDEQLNQNISDVVRISKRVERLSEALKYAKVPSKAAAYQELNRMQIEVKDQLEGVKKQVESAENRQRQMKTRSPADADEIALGRRLAAERDKGLKSAEEAQKIIYSNAEVVQQQAVEETSSAQQAAPMQQAAQPAQQNQAAQQGVQPLPADDAAAKSRPTVLPMVQFPRVGEVYTFGQRQGTGRITLQYELKEMSARNWDLLLWALLMSGLAVIALRGSALVATRRRIATALIVACIIAVAFGAALDIAIPGIAIGLLLLVPKKRGVKTNGLYGHLLNNSGRRGFL